MTDDTGNDIYVEVPKNFDPKDELIDALRIGLQESVNHFLRRFEDYTTRENPEMVLRVPKINISLITGDGNEENPSVELLPEVVLEDTNIDN